MILGFEQKQEEIIFKNYWSKYYSIFSIDTKLKY